MKLLFDAYTAPVEFFRLNDFIYSLPNLLADFAALAFDVVDQHILT